MVSVKKTCTRCLKAKPLLDFPTKGKGERNKGRHSWCRRCKHAHNEAKQAELRAAARAVRENYFMTRRKPT